MDKGEIIMEKLNEFMELITGRFNNALQYEERKGDGTDFPYAEHINTVCNDKIKNLPLDFEGVFMIEESYYTLGEKRNVSPHLFLFTEEEKGIRLTSYDIPVGFDKNTFSYINVNELNFNELKVSEKFVPALYTEKDGTWEGGSVSMFSPIMKFTLWERFSKEVLEVSESIEVNGKKTFGYDSPILYRREIKK